MTTPATVQIIPQPPSVIVTEPLALDDLTFSPTPSGNIEHATRGGSHIGDVLYDLAGYWFARKRDRNGDLSDWIPMRCAHEARAYLVSGRMGL